MEKVPDNVAVGPSPSGWMIIGTFYEYIADIFYKRLVERKVSFPVLLFMDGHKTQINLELHEFCVQKKILLVCLPPNATHIMQPCDVGIFRSLKVEWRKVVLHHQQVSTHSITKLNFAPLFYEAYSKALKSDTVKNGFKACGLYPLNPNNIDFTKCISTRRQSLKHLDAPDVIEKQHELLQLQSQIPTEVLKNFIEI